MSLIVDEHRHLLADAIRLTAFRRAIAAVVRPGAVVLDLASGTGILGLFACQAGARRVYAVEATGLIEIARAVAAANGFADRLTFLQGLSSDIPPPEAVDVIVCDQVGRFGFEAGLLQYGPDARDRWLKAGGVFMPESVDLLVAPIESDDLHGLLDFWRTRPAGFDFSAVGAWAANTGYPATLSSDSLLGTPATIAHLDLARATRAPFRGQACVEIARAGTLHGLGGWFAATLCEGVCLSNGPLAPDRIQRRNVFLPIAAPCRVERGDLLDLSLHVVPTDDIVTWSVRVTRPSASSRVVATADGSTAKGLLLSRDDLRRMDPRFRPALTPRGVARQSVLELCDGARSIAEIEREMERRHPDLFASPGDAGAFVAEVVKGYSR